MSHSGHRVRVLLAISALLAASCSATTERGVTATPSGPERSDPSGRGRTRVSERMTETDGSLSPEDRSGRETVAGRRSKSIPGTKGIATGRGVSATTIRIGIAYRAKSGYDQEAEGAGAKDIAQGDGRAAAQAIIDDLNAGGGIAGRKIMPVYASFDIRQPFAAEWQKLCSTFTEDHEVFAVVVDGNATAPEEILPSCLARSKTILINDVSIALDQLFFNRYAPYFYAPGEMRSERWAIVIDQLVAAGYFGKSPKIGVLRFDTEPSERLLTRVIKPRLAHHNFRVEDDAAFVPPDSTAGIGALAAQASSVALRFRSKGITHALFLATTGPLLFVFTAAAESNGYRPRYGVTSTDEPESNQNNDPPAQLRGAMGVGWQPAYDVAEEQDPKDNPAQARCQNSLKKRAVNVPSRLFLFNVLAVCDGLFFLKATLDRAGALTPAGVRAAADRLGTAYQSPLTFATRFGPGRFDGVSAVRLLVFDEACGCFKYKGPKRTAP